MTDIDYFNKIDITNVKKFIEMIDNKIADQKDKKMSSELLETAYKTLDGKLKRGILQKAIYFNPRNVMCLYHLGNLFMEGPNSLDVYIGHYLLEKMFDYNLSVHSFQGRVIAFLVGRYNYQIRNYKTAYKFFKLADESQNIPDDVHKIQLATIITGYPESVSDANNIITNYVSRTNYLLKNNINIIFIKERVFNSCFLSLFNLEIYYNADFKLCMSINYKLIIKTFPNYHYISPHLQKCDLAIKSNRYKIAIISGFIGGLNSVTADFGGVINKLSKDKFDITLIYLSTNDKEEIYFKTHNQIKILCSDYNDNWLEHARTEIARLNLDLILYLEPVMCPCINKLMMSKLAKIQAVSHGHPVTSGIPSNIMNYYVSWGAAELDYNIAKNHYTEKLLLLPKNKMHQYYNKRVIKDEVSAINNISFKNITRSDFVEYVPSDGNWYLCMQKPFKRHPDFDNMLSSIMLRDPNARILLHEVSYDFGMTNKEMQEIVCNRLLNAGANLKRIHFIPCQPAHKLMALYKLSDVILDSYYAGGCTTTREALEIGCVVITLPAKYLGSRWTLAYYSIIDVMDVIAKDKEHYVELAVMVGTNTDVREKLKNKILNNVNKLFYKDEAVTSWTNALEKMIANEN